MESSELPTLKIDKEFKNLIPPLNRQEYLQLEQNLLDEGCLDPLIVWNGTIVDGHNRYEICRKHNIPFRIRTMEFECREEVSAWICTHQLDRRNITEETRKYLIGMQFEAEKVINHRRNSRGNNQYTYSDPHEIIPANPSHQKLPVPSGHKTAQRIGEQHHISWNTVQKYASYARALKEIREKSPSIVLLILAGRYKISHDNVLEMANLSPENIRKVIARLESSQQLQPQFLQYKSTRSAIQNSTEPPRGEKVPPKPSIKDMPKYDPDSEVTSLTLTIPTWTNTIQRAHEKADLTAVSSRAKDRLSDALAELVDAAAELVNAMEEK